MARLRIQHIRETSQRETGDEENKPKGRPSRGLALGFVLSSWRRRLIALGFLLIGLFLLQEPISSSFLTWRDNLVSFLGWGIAPGGLWLALFLRTALKHPRSLVRRWGAWLGSLVLFVGILGVLAFFRAPSGILDEVTLGGRIGQTIIGSYLALGVFRVLLVFVASAWIMSPGTSKVVTLGLIKVLVTSYVFGVMAWNNLARVVGHLYRRVPVHRHMTHGLRYMGSAASTLANRPTKAVRRRTIPPVSSTPSHREALTPLDELLQGIRKREEHTAPRAQNISIKISTPSQREAPTPLDVLLQGKEGKEPAPAKGQPIFPISSTPEEAEAPTLLQGKEKDEVELQRDGWLLPSLRILHISPEGSISETEKQTTAQHIQDTLAEYGIEVEVGQIKPGPTVTMYGLVPGWVRRYQEVKERDEQGKVKLDERGKPIISKVESKTRVKIDSILAREKDLALALAATSIRIEAPVPGESLVGVEVPNANPSVVTLRSDMESEAYQKLRTKAHLPIALGKGSGGEPVVADLTNMPHLLIAGATGSGKSVCINALISCLILEKSPSELRLLLVDPKRVELTPFNGIPHLLTPVVVEADEVAILLKGLIKEMLSRYRLFEEVRARNIETYNRKTSDKIPYIVVAVDELADIMMSAPHDIEHTLCRLAQLGRATGIHLVVATQRPSVDVVTGLIKANFPSRISFAVTSQVDSRTILDSTGADKLLGRGDMLYLPIDAPKPRRLQGVYISDQEVEDLVEHWRRAQGPAIPLIRLETEEDQDDEEAFVDEQRDNLLGKAIELAQQHSRLSTSFLQRHLRIGYPRAARLMDQLEEEGIVASGELGKSRDVTLSQRRSLSSTEREI